MPREGGRGLRRRDGPMSAGSPFLPGCRHFSGYRPCFPDRETCEGCGQFVPRGARIVLINLDSMGDVLRSTAVLPPLKRRYPESHLTWITLPRAAPLLEANPLVDRLLTADAALPFILDSLEFDAAFNVDKGLPSGAMINRIKAGEKKGFGVDACGAIHPLNPEAEELFRLGLSDRRKFFVNRKSENQLLAEAFGLEYRADRYVFRFRDSECDYLKRTRERLGLHAGEVIVGFNTGCSNLYPYKKQPLHHQKALIYRLREARPGWKILLLGGTEDTERNAELANDLGSDIINTPAGEGLRRGMIYTALADVVFTGDSLGMHMAIALNKRVVAWFGLTCEQEIELYGRGEKVLARVDCRPCWRKSCTQQVKCYDRVDQEEALAAILRQGELAAQEKGALGGAPGS